jgi:hypothetical protein
MGALLFTLGILEAELFTGVNGGMTALLQAQKSQLDEEIRAANQASAWASRDQEARQVCLQTDNQHLFASTL